MRALGATTPTPATFSAPGCRVRRSVGSAIGVAAFGTIANAIITARGGAEVSAAVQAGSQAVFLAALVAAGIAFAASPAVPRVRVEDVETAAGAPPASA